LTEIWTCCTAQVRSCVSMIEKMAEQMASLQKSVVVLEQASGS
jgi:hypothetical protein